MPDYTGKRAGNYTILKKLGDGGFATVFLAQHTILEKKAAVKFLLEEWVKEEDVVGRFFDEARTMERLKDHPNIIAIIDIASPELCEKEGLPPYFIMEYIDGKSLEQFIHSDEAFSLDWILNVITHSLSALAHCHKLGVVHRDIKPSNILIKADGTVKLTDFGIAKAKLNTSKTGSGLTLGSTDYMSPEQALGKRDLDHRSDIYSLGVTLYELVTGKLPFISDNANSVALMHIQEPPKPPIEVNDAVPSRLNDIILKAMEKKREDRFQTCEDFLDAMKTINEPEAPVVAEIETVDLTKMRAETPEESMVEKETGSRTRTTKIQESLGSKRFRGVLFLVAVFIGFTLVFLGIFKGVNYLQECNLDVKSVPVGALIFIDGTMVGSSPLSLRYKSGVCRVEIKAEGYHPMPLMVELPPGKMLSLERVLRKIDTQGLENSRKALQVLSAAVAALANSSANPPKQRVTAKADALRKVKNVLDENPDNEEAFIEFVEFCIKNKELIPNGEYYFKELLEKFPENPVYLTMLGKLKMAKGDMKVAIDLFSKAWYKGSDNVYLLNCLGDYSLAANDKKKASQYFKNSLFLNPGQDTVTQKLQGL